MPQQEITAPQTHFDNLDDVFSNDLRESITAEAATVPLPSPPRPIRLVVLVLTTEADGYKHFMDSTLNRNGGNQAKHSMGDIP